MFNKNGIFAVGNMNDMKYKTLIIIAALVCLPLWNTVRAQELPTDGQLTIRPMLQKLGERLLKGKTGSIVAIQR